MEQKAVQMEGKQVKDWEHMEGRKVMVEADLQAEANWAMAED